MNIQLLLAKWLNNEITTEELRDWYNKNGKEENMEAELCLFLEKEWEKEDHPEELHYSPGELQQLITNVLKSGEVRQMPVYRTKQFWLKRWKPAAAVLIFVISGAVVWQLHKPQKQVQELQPVADIVPGTNKAVLTLANGSQVLLDSGGSRVIYQGNAVIKQSAGGKLAYSGDAPSPDAATNAGSPVVKVEYNTLATPKGGTFQLTLPDGTRAWLNSASYIRYPVTFNRNERVVEISGEVYFDVVHNAKVPFRIKTKDAWIEDVGTEMDICSYPDEKTSSVTLVEGAARVWTPSGKNKAVLKAGQQGLLDSASLVVQQADAEAVTAWKNGYFRFNNEDIFSVMKKLSRWYDIKVEYQGNLSPDNYTGTISMHRNISTVLDMLSYSQTVHFKIEGQKVIVKP